MSTVHDPTFLRWKIYCWKWNIIWKASNFRDLEWLMNFIFDTYRGHATDCNEEQSLKIDHDIYYTAFSRKHNLNLLTFSILNVMIIICILLCNRMKYFFWFFEFPKNHHPNASKYSSIYALNITVLDVFICKTCAIFNK